MTNNNELPTRLEYSLSIPTSDLIDSVAGGIMSKKGWNRLPSDQYRKKYMEARELAEEAVKKVIIGQGNMAPYQGLVRLCIEKASCD